MERENVTQTKFHEFRFDPSDASLEIENAGGESVCLQYEEILILRALLNEKFNK